MACIRCGKKTCANIIYCDTCQAENTAYNFCEMIEHEYQLFIKEGGRTGQFKAGKPARLGRYNFKLNILVDSKLGTVNL